MVEKYGPNAEEIRQYLKKLFSLVGEIPESVVIGCTHYSYLIPEIKRLLGQKVMIYDGAYGAAKQLQRILTQKRLLSDCGGTIRYETSGPEETVEMMERFFQLAGMFDESP